MKMKVWFWSLMAVGMWASAANAQSAGASNGCPALPAEQASDMRWDMVSFPGTLLCRALRNADGSEAFVLTISRSSPFKPRRSDRAEIGAYNGREVQWYRGELATDPSAVIRETLFELDDQRVVHVFMRAKDTAALAREQQLVLSLSFAGN